MSADQTVRIDTDTDVEFGATELTAGEWEWLKNELIIQKVTTPNSPPKIKHITLDAEKLVRIAFEYDILKDVASTVEVEVLRHFRESTETTLTTGEIADAVDRSKSSVSRALSSLVEKGQLEKVQQGVYRTRVR